MAHHSSARTYGSVDISPYAQPLYPQPTHLGRARNSNSVGETASPPPPLLAAHAIPGTQRSGGSKRTRNWLKVTALICALCLGTVAVANRGGRSSTSATAAARVGLSGTNTAGGGITSDPTAAGAATAADDKGNMLFSGKLTQHSRPTSPESLASNAESSDPSTALEISITNFYHERDGKPGAKIPWLKDVKLAEPYRDTTMRVSSPRDGCRYAWTVQATNSGSEEVLTRAEGPEVVVQFTRLDENSVRLLEIDEATGEKLRETEDIVMVKYVRREIRTLTDDEREELLDAMLIIWTVRVDGGEGQELYGDDYADIWAINRLHFKAASTYECDHFHDGMGFLTSHSMLTNTFEYSLQRVNPKLTVPYWDFTIETSSSGNNPDGMESQESSPLFSDTWFGSSDYNDNMVKDGRWAYTSIPRVKTNNPGSVNSDVYSKLRSPWNVNDRPYLTRGMGEICGQRVQKQYDWPTCDVHYQLTTQYTDFYSWVWKSLYDPHGPVHVWLGGVLDCDETYGKLRELVGVYNAQKLAFYSFVHRKNLYRSGLWSCDGTVGVEMRPEELLQSDVCGCLQFDLTQGDDYKTLRDQIVFLEDYISDFDEDTQREVVATICNGIMNDGDHLQSSSSLDPTFWVTHPTMERLWMFKRLTGTMTDLTWPDEDITYTDTTTGETVVESLSLYSETCLGHRGKDVFPFGFASDAGSGSFKARTGIRGDNDAGNTLNNREILQLLDARLNSLNYIYDTFEWSHCMADGVNFEDAYDSARTVAAAAESKRPTFKQGELRYPRYRAFEEDSEKWASKEKNSKKY